MFIKIAVVLVAYIIGAKAGFSFVREGSEVSAFWLATGTNLFFTFLWGPIALVGIGLGSFIIHLPLAAQPWVAFTIPIGDIDPPYL